MKYELPSEPAYLDTRKSRAFFLKCTRIELGWTQAEMAEALGMSRVHVGQMERGDKLISKRTDLAVRYLATLPYKAMSRVERIRNESAWATIEDVVNVGIEMVWSEMAANG